jgi:hypothetical protein
MKMLVLLMLSSAVFAQTKTTKRPTPVSPTHKSEESQAHDSVMKFLQGLRMKELPEGKKLLAETQWILGQADRGQNFYSRPDYTEVTPIYAALFDTDVPSVKGYKELFDMKAVAEDGTARNLKYLVISFKDAIAGKWKILLSGSGLDIDAQVEFFKNNLADTRYLSSKENYAIYGKWLLCAGRIKEARSALETAQTASDLSPYSEPDPIHDIQISALLDVIGRVVPKAVGNKQ